MTGIHWCLLLHYMYIKNFSDSKCTQKVTFHSAITGLAKRNKLSKNTIFIEFHSQRLWSLGSISVALSRLVSRTAAGNQPEHYWLKTREIWGEDLVTSPKCYWFYRHIRFHNSQKLMQWNLTNQTWSGLLARNLLATVSPLGNLNRRLDTGAVHSEPGSAGRWSISDNLWACKGRYWN